MRHRPSLLALCLLLATAVSAAEVRFQAWQGTCDTTCVLTTPVEFGARLQILPADDGGLAVRVLDIAPDERATISFDFMDGSSIFKVGESAWRADGPSAVAIDDPHLRAIILERLPGNNSLRIGWSRLGEARSTEIPTSAARAAIEWLTQASGARVCVVDQEANSPRWAQSPMAFALAIVACRATAPVPLIEVRNASAWTESEYVLETVDRRGTKRHCVARRDGSEVTSWRKIDGDAGSLHEHTVAPVLTLPPSGECYDHEILYDDTDRVIGLLSHDVC